MAVSGAHPLTQRLPAVDGLRGVAILLVMALHFVGQYDVANPSSSLAAVARAGWVGVDLFFVLSGYLITSILLSTKERAKYFAPFYWRRLLRIGPPYTRVLVFFLYLATSHATGSPPRSSRAT